MRMRIGWGRPQISLFLGHGHFGLDNISFLGARRPCVGAPRPYQGFAEIKHKQGETGVGGETVLYLRFFCIFFYYRTFNFNTMLTFLFSSRPTYFIGTCRPRNKKKKIKGSPGAWTVDPYH